ncbi:MAG: glycosyltransferase family 4 protein [Flavobacteriales bacterium]|nr:glycosyltransferase family 4 protein [Flavobacteriales bacterium]MCB9166912.1 glycosyltransferase family 4 protein [Flavobacteriales bacterium]MCB9182256.1 glycosyltransferase family 4 protein [Flavobacteriales bacterium]
MSETQASALRLAFATTSDPADVRKWSGSIHFLTRTLRRQDVDLEVIGPLLRRRLLLTKAVNRVRAMAVPGTFLPSERTEAMARRFARAIGTRFRAGQAQAVLSPGSIPVALLDAAIPHAFFTDATFTGLLHEYPELEGYDGGSVEEGHHLERAALQGSVRAFYTSRWAADSAVAHYGADPARIRVLPFGPNLDLLPTRDQVLRAVEQRPTERCELLFVGVTWERKGGPLALEVATLLNARGLPTRLTVVGCTPPGPLPDFVEVVPFIVKDTALGQRHLVRLMLHANFLIMPSLAECFGIVYAEASVMGLPSLARDTGGVADAVRDGVNGRLFPSDAVATDYADAVEALMRDPDAYRTLCADSRREHETRLNWPATARGIRDELVRALE